MLYEIFYYQNKRVQAIKHDVFDYLEFYYIDYNEKVTDYNDIFALNVMTSAYSNLLR